VKRVSGEVDGSLPGEGWIEGSLAFEHGAGDAEEAIGDGAERASMTVTPMTQRGVFRSAPRIVLNGDPGPVI